MADTYLISRPLRFVTSLILLATSVACAPSIFDEVIVNHSIKGHVDLSVDDGTAGGPAILNGAQSPVPVSAQRTKGVSFGSARVGDWNSIYVRADANQGMPAAPWARPLVVSLAEEISQFTLKKNGKQVDMNVTLHWFATLQRGSATIDVKAAITPVGGAPVCTLRGTYNLVTNAGDNTKIDVMGPPPPSSPPQNFQMINGGGSSNKQIIAPSCTLSAGDYNLTWSVSVASVPDTKAEVNVDSAILALHP